VSILVILLNVLGCNGDEYAPLNVKALARSIADRAGHARVVLDS
jgi:hypothetical protein